MNNLNKRILSTIILLPLVFYFLSQGTLMLFFFATVGFIVAYYEWYMMSKNNFYKIFGFIMLIFSFYTFFIISMDFNKVLLVLIICISTDIGGYVFGKTFKGPKLTKISPNKTYAGLIGGYFLTLLCILIFSNLINFYKPNIQLYLITIIISSVSQIGDLIISYFKRLSKIKNTGKIIPGHGGLLDRIDGMIFAFPIYYIFELSGHGVI